MFQNLNHIRANTGLVIVDVTGCKDGDFAWSPFSIPDFKAFAFFMIWRSFFGANSGSHAFSCTLTPLNRFANRLPMTYGIDCLGDTGIPASFPSPSVSDRILSRAEIRASDV